MDDLIELVSKTYGIAGLILLSPFIGLYFVYKDNQKLRTELTEAHKTHAKELKEVGASHAEKLSQTHDKVTAGQVQRVQDAQGITSMVVAIVGEQSALNRETNLVLERCQIVLEKIELPKRAIPLDAHSSSPKHLRSPGGG